MNYEKIYRRKEGHRIKIVCYNNYNRDEGHHIAVDVYKALKGKRFSKVAPLHVCETSIDGYHNNGGGILDKNNNSVFFCYSNILEHPDNLKYYYITREEELEAKISFWELLKPTIK